MKRVTAFMILSVMALSAVTVAAAQENKGEVRFRGDYYNARRAEHDSQGMEKGSVVFLGNSITERGDWASLFEQRVVNRGIGGDNTFGMLDRLPDILEAQPAKLFIMAGVNDISANRSIDTIIYNIDKIIGMTKAAAPGCKIYVQSAFPINDEKLAYDYLKDKNPEIKKLNMRLKEISKKTRVKFINLAPLCYDGNGQLKGEFTDDGIHLTPEAYEVWADYLKKKKYLK